MDIARWAVIPLKALLALTFAALLMLQTLSIPGQFAHMAKESSDPDSLRWLLVIVIDLGLLCVQVVIVCVWKLLGMVRDDRIFSPRSLVWVDVIVGAIATAWLLLAGLYVYSARWWDDPGAPVVMTLMLMVGAVLGLLMVVMRTLLRQATVLRTDMDAVI